MILSDLVQKYQSFKDDNNIWKINAMLAKCYNFKCNIHQNVNKNPWTKEKSINVACTLAVILDFQQHQLSSNTFVLPIKVVSNLMKASYGKW